MGLQNESGESLICFIDPRHSGLGQALIADEPALVGHGLDSGTGLPRSKAARWTATLVITEQQGNTFAAFETRPNPTGDEDERLWGGFTPGGQP